MVTVFSAIIPAYNAGATIRETLDSVAAQTLRDFEIVVVDDGSTDQTAEVCAAYAAAHPDLDFRLIRQVNAGQGAARNAALKVARGKYAAFLDADDLWDPSKLERVADEFERCPSAALVCHGMSEQQTDGRTVPIPCRPIHGGTYAEFMFDSESPVFTSGATAVASVVIAEGGFSEDRLLQSVEDYDLWARMVRDGHTVRYMPDVLGVYRRGGMTGNLPEFARRRLRVIEVHYERSFAGSAEFRWRYRRRRAHVLYQTGRELWFGGRKAMALRYLARALAEHPKNFSGLAATVRHILLKRALAS